MSKTKSSKREDKASSKALKVKDAGVTKPSQAPKTKSKEIARKVAAKEEKSKKKKGKKEPTPSSSSSESDSDEEMDSPESSSSSSESESEDEKPKKEAVKPKKEVAKAKVEVKSKEPSDSSSESGSSSESESSESEEEKEAPKKASPKVEAKKVESKKESSESESDSSESGSDSESSSEEAPAKAEKVTKKPEVNGGKADSDDSSDGSSAESDSEDSDEESADSDESSSDEAPKKRKAESEEASTNKKSKTTESAPAPEATQETGNLFIGNLSWNVDEEWLRSEFEEFGELVGARIVTERDTGRSRGFGYVEFAKAADAEKAHAQKKDVELDGRKMNVDFANARTNAAPGKDRAQSRAQNFGDQTSPESDTLFVGNMAFSSNEDSLHGVFSEHGDIQGIRLPTDPDSGRPKGFGYVQFSSVDEARQALNALHGSEIDGRPVRLDFSTPRQNTGDSPRGGGRGGGRGGRGGFDRGGRGGGRGRGGFDRGGRGGGGGRGGSTNRGGFGDFAGKKITF